jgi:hypothetical protein
MLPPFLILPAKVCFLRPRGLTAADEWIEFEKSRDSPRKALAANDRET